MKEAALLDIKLFWIVTYRFHDVYLARVYYDLLFLMWWMNRFLIVGAKEPHQVNSRQRMEVCPKRFVSVLSGGSWSTASGRINK